MGKKGIAPIIAIVLLLMMVVAAGGLAYVWVSQVKQMGEPTQLTNSEPLEETNLSLFKQTLEEIEKNCDSTFLTTRYGKDGWFVVGQVCIEENYCRLDYIKLEDCVGK